MFASDYTKYRMLEALPGTLVWLTFGIAIGLSFFAPKIALAVVILFDLYWLLRVFYFVFYLAQSWHLYRKEKDREWFHDLQTTVANWKNYRHVIFLPTYQEDYAVVDATLGRLLSATYNAKKFIVVLAGEERDAANFASIKSRIEKKYRHAFHALLFTEHPADLPNEIPGKGSNLHWSGHKVKQYIDEQKINYSSLIVSTFDIDTIVHPQYFAALTHAYATHPNPERASFQPAVLYNNNLWESPALVRVAAMGTTFWLFTELARPERLFTFSSHSMSWQALVDVGFWEKRIVTEDSRIFLQCFFRYNGDYTVVPLYVPVSMDMVAAGGYLKSLAALYRQQRRWAWGIEHLPYMLWNFRKNKKIPLRKKLYYIWNLGEGMYTWATAPLIIFLLGHLPVWLASFSVTETALAQNAPFVLEFLLQLSSVGIIVSAIISLSLLPPRPDGHGRSVYLVMLLQWVLLPISLILFGSLPAIDAQTRLLLGRYLGFNVTAKVRS